MRAGDGVCDELKINPASLSSRERATKREFPGKMLPDD